MIAYIPSTKRVYKQPSFVNISPHVSTFIVVPEDEYKMYNFVYPGNVLACPIHGIAPTRDWIVEHAIANKHKKFVMFDDDVTPQYRNDEGRILNATSRQTAEGLHWLSEALDRWAHAGWSHRALGYNVPGTAMLPGRMMHVLGYRSDVLEEHGFRFCTGVDPDHVQDDFNMTLQLLTNGFGNEVSLIHRASPSASNSKGGASTWRTLDIHNKSAKRMAELFPQFVSLREKKAWQGYDGVQYDITVQWKKALAHGEQHARHQGP